MLISIFEQKKRD